MLGIEQRGTLTGAAMSTDHPSDNNALITRLGPYSSR